MPDKCMNDMVEIEAHYITSTDDAILVEFYYDKLTSKEIWLPLDPIEIAEGKREYGSILHIKLPRWLDDDRISVMQ